MLTEVRSSLITLKYTNLKNRVKKVNRKNRVVWDNYANTKIELLLNIYNLIYRKTFQNNGVTFNKLKNGGQANSTYLVILSTLIRYYLR